MMNIDSILAGRETDALIAEKVMGLTLTENGYGEWTTVLHNGTVTGAVSQLLHYSTDIAAAWKVIEKLYEMDYYPSLQVLGNLVTIYADEDNPIKIQKAKDYNLPTKMIKTVCITYGETMPLAICRAALEALTS